jgi:hypothetical protein
MFLGSKVRRVRRADNFTAISNANTLMTASHQDDSKFDDQKNVNILNVHG